MLLQWTANAATDQLVMNKEIQAGEAINMGRSALRGETCCPACGEHFEIHPNRVFKITGKNRFMNFVEGLEQFQNHADVICPACGNRFNSPDSRLFGVQVILDCVGARTRVRCAPSGVRILRTHSQVTVHNNRLNQTLEKLPCFSKHGRFALVTRSVRS